MNRKVLKIILYILVFIVCASLLFKLVIRFVEPDFESTNTSNLNIIKEQEIEGDYQFNIVGNIENSIDIFDDKIVPMINQDLDSKFVISVGDAVSDNGEDKYRIINKSFNKLNISSLLSVGEGETSSDYDDNALNYYHHYGAFNYAFTYNNDYFIMLDTTGLTSNLQLQTYIKQQLLFSKKYNHTFIFMNNSPVDYQDKKLNQKYNATPNQEIQDIIEENDVEYVFSNSPGYYSEYEHNNTKYYTTGGAGGTISYRDEQSYYHYLEVEVSQDEVIVNNIKIENKFENIFTQTFYNIYIYFHSILYTSFYNIALILCVFTILVILSYLKLTKKVEFYRDFTNQITLADVQKKKLNIAMFTDNYYPFIGGVPISIHRLKTELEKLGHNVRLYAPDYPNYLENDKTIFRVELITFFKTKKFNFPITKLKSKALKEDFNKHNFDIVHVHHPFWLGSRAKDLAQENNIPVVLTYHTRFEKYAHMIPFIQTIFENILSHRMIKRFAQDTQGIIAPTNAAKEYLENIGVSKPKIVLPTGVDFKYYEQIQISEVDNLRAKYLNEDELLIVSVSRLSEEKNIMFLLHAINQLTSQTTVKFKFLIIGDGPERNNLKEYINSNNLEDIVELVGRVKPEKIALYYQAADLFIYSSTSETQGMVILEALAGMTPVVAINSSGISDMIVDNYNGFTSPEILAEYVSLVAKILEDDELREKLSNNALRFAKKYSTKLVAQEALLFYYSILVSYPNRGGKNER